MICPNCGSDNPEQGKFCKSCGQMLSPVFVPEPEASPRSRRLTAVLSAVILLILAAAVIAGAFLLGKHDDLEGVELDNDAESMIEEVTETALTEAETTTTGSMVALEDAFEETEQLTNTTTTTTVKKDVVKRTIAVGYGDYYTYYHNDEQIPVIFPEKLYMSDLNFRNSDDYKKGIQSISIRIYMMIEFTYSDDSTSFTPFECIVTSIASGSGASIELHPWKDDFGNECLQPNEMDAIKKVVHPILKEFLTETGTDANGYPIYAWLDDDYDFQVGESYDYPSGDYIKDVEYCTRAALNDMVNSAYYSYGQKTLRDVMTE